MPLIKVKINIYRNIYLIIIAILFILTECLAFDHESEIRFTEVFNTEAYNIGIAQDKDGFIWIGTSDGLVRYDGHSTKLFKAGGIGSLSSNIVEDVFVDSEGLIWVGSVDGLNVYDKKTNAFRVFRNIPEDPNSISHNMSNWAAGQITEDKEGLIWISTAKGLNSYDKKTGQFTRYLHDPNDQNSISDDQIWTVISDKNDIIWIGTQNGLNRYDKKLKQFTRYYHNSKKLNGLSDNWVFSIIEGSDGNLWIGTNAGGLNKFNRESGIFTQYKHEAKNKNSLASNNVFFLREDQNKNIWIGRNYSNPVGLEKLNIETGEFSLFEPDPDNKKSISGKIIQSFLFDQSGMLWVVDDLGPVLKVDTKKHRFKLYINDPKRTDTICSNSVTTIIEDNNQKIWFGTNNNGICKYDPITQKFTNYKRDPKDPKSISHDYAFAVFEDSDGEFWVGANDGTLSIFDRKVGKVSKHYKIGSSAPMGIIEDYNTPGVFWFATSFSGIYRFDKLSGKSKIFKHDKKDTKSVSEGLFSIVFQDEQGTIWVPTLGGGLNKYNKEDESFTHFKHDIDNPESISSNDIRDCFVDSRGNFWITTSGGGLNKLNRKTGKFSRYGNNHGFTTNSLVAMLEDDSGNLWITSNRGLFKFNLDLEKVTRHYDKRDGLQGDKFSVVPTNAYKTKNGEMWFAGHKGVNKFNPSKIVDNTYIPPIVLISFTQNGNALHFDSAIEKIKNVELNWQNNYFEFEFAALNYTLSDKNRFAYKMEGLDKNWFYSGTDRHGRYSGIPPGNYQLKLKGANNDGLWNEAGISIDIKITPPFWRTWTFYISCLFFLTGLIVFVSYSFFRVRANRLLAEQAIQKENHTATLNKVLKESQEKTKASLKEKETLLYEIHHRVKNNMTVVSSLLRLQARQMKDKTAIDALMDSQSRIRSMSAIHESLYMSENLASIDMNRYISKISRTIFQNYSSDNNIKLNIDVENIILSAKQASPLGLIANELLTNSIKYAFPNGKKGEINMRLTQKAANLIEFKYFDNGVGFPENFDVENAKSLGLHLIFLLGEGQLGGSVDVKNDTGLSFIFNFEQKTNTISKAKQ